MVAFGLLCLRWFVCLVADYLLLFGLLVILGLWFDFAVVLILVRFVTSICLWCFNCLGFTFSWVLVLWCNLPWMVWVVLRADVGLLVLVFCCYVV